MLECKISAILLRSLLLFLQFYTDNEIVKRESSIRICKQQLIQGGNYGFKN
jgi:hypothetical protein